MKDYRDILIKDLISVSAIMTIIFVVCVVGFIIIRKLALEKYLNILISVFLIATIVFGGYHIVNVSLDLTYNSFETYAGKYSYPARDTVVLDENNMKLYAAISLPNTSNDIMIIYSRRSKIVVGFRLNE